MNKVLLQFWEESERGFGIRPDGASLHIDSESYRKYINDIYDSRYSKDIPDEYDRVVGPVVETMVTDDLYQTIIQKKNLRLTQYQLNNLLKLDNLKVNDN